MATRTFTNKATPGPWRSEYFEDTGWQIYGPDESVLSPTPANRAVLDAAPDLLEVARLALQYWEDPISSKWDRVNVGDELLAAIAKAEGKE